MKLALSKSLFNKTSTSLTKDCNYNLRLLYKLDSSDSDHDWICSYRSYSNLTYKYLDDNPFVPNYLKFAGFLVNTNSNFDVNDIKSLNLDLEPLKDFYLLILENESTYVSSLKDSFSVFKVNLCSGDQVNLSVPLEEIRWVENDDSEFKSRNLFLVNVSLLLFSKLTNIEDENFQNFEGLTRMEKLPESVTKSFVESLKEHSEKLTSEENQPSVILSEPFESTKDKFCEFYTKYTLGFGFNSRGRRHAFVVSGEFEEFKLCVRVLLQNNVALPLEDTEGLEEDLVSNSILKECNKQLSRLCNFVQNDSTCLFCYLSSHRNPDDEFVFKAHSNEELVEDQRNTKNNRNHSKKSSSGKGKGPKNTQKTSNSPKKNSLKKESFNFLQSTQLFGSSYFVKFNSKTGSVSLSLTSDSKSKESNGSNGMSLNLVFKFLMEGSEELNEGVPFGGVSLPLFNYYSSSNFDVEGVLDRLEETQRLKFLFNPYELLDRSVLVSPHLYGNLFPPWISPKKSAVYTVNGNYQYFHYTQGGLNDVGWGCCYRSLQLVCSWYFLHYLTPKLVPTHSVIQQVLKENDLSHKDLKIGSSTWIGTVESGYFINWYLDFNYKTLYLGDVSEFRNYNVVIADHFKNQGTPIIVGAGAYAYVILGICLESEQGEVAYLIADPHYSGDDTLKNVLNKGGLGWKKIDFLSKASDGKFINLCLPLLDKYSA